MTEEEGQRLDEALSNAFKLMGNRGDNAKSKTKKMEAIALLHFRNRVVDLLIIYLKSGPELVTVFEILTVLYRMLEQFSADDVAELALFKKVQEAIDLAVTTKIPSEVTTLTAADTANYARTFVTKSANPKGIEERSVALQKIVRFLTQVDDHLAPSKQKKGDSNLADVIAGELNLFLTQRAPAIGLNIFQHVLQSTWTGNWQQLGVILASGIVRENRIFKRVQSLDLLRTFQKNVRFIKSASEQVQATHLKKWHDALAKYADVVNGPITAKEFKSFVQLLLDVRFFHNKNDSVKCYLNWTALESGVRSWREQITLDSQTQSVYAQLCKIVGWEVVKTNAKNGTATENGDDAEVQMEHENGVAEEEGSGGAKSAQKRKNNNRKEKKLKKEKRFKLASDGLDENIHFN